MELSHDHGFIFVHVPRTGGNSVSRALQPFAERPPVPPGGRTPGIRRLHRSAPYALRERRFGHVTARELRDELPGTLFADAFKFAFVRNPWDWQVSTYHYVVQKREHPEHRRFVELGSFERYLDWRVREGPELQAGYVLDEAGEQLVDFVGRHETLAEDFAEACARIGIETSLPHVNRSRHADYRSVYTRRTRDLVAAAYHTDIEAFGYAFG